MPQKLLPPPVETILIYAAYGFAKRNKMIAPSGKPKLPERKVWAAFFFKLAETERGIAQIKSYAYTGMNAWNVPNSISSCLEAAFRWPHMARKLKSTLQLDINPTTIIAQESLGARKASTSEYKKSSANYKSIARSSNFTPH